MPSLSHLLMACEQKNIREEMYWLLSDIAAGTRVQISTLCRNVDPMLSLTFFSGVDATLEHK